MKVILIDGYNMLHRCRFGMVEGQYNIVYTFFRGFRALVETFNPDKVIFSLEGNPNFRYELYPEYKANRKIDKADLNKVEEYEDFKRQRDIVVDLLARLPVEVLKHSEYEGDDLIGKLATSVYNGDEVIVITGDTDFYQLLENKHIKIYNPIKKEFVNQVSKNYLLYKSMVGDTTDNISGIPRVGPKTAQKILEKTSEEIEAWLDEKPERRAVVERNKRLIRFADVPLNQIINLHQQVDFEYVKKKFDEMNFKTMITEKAWNKFVETFANC